MDWKLFFSTFAMIFLAELGDKTQLTAMARSAAGRWTVFFAASAALVLSTLVAVLFGSQLTKLVPENYIKITAAIVFLIFGGMMIYDVAYGKEEKEAAPVRNTLLTRTLLELAANFEESSATDYLTLASAETNPARKDLYLRLAEDEKQHVLHLRNATVKDTALDTPHPGTEEIPAPEELTHDVAAGEDPTLMHAIEHEEALAGFYEEMARVSHLPGLSNVFNTLAAAERQHATWLREHLSSDQGQDTSTPPTSG